MFIFFLIFLIPGIAHADHKTCFKEQKTLENIETKIARGNYHASYRPALKQQKEKAFIRLLDCLRRNSDK